MPKVIGGGRVAGVWLHVHLAAPMFSFVLVTNAVAVSCCSVLREVYTGQERCMCRRVSSAPDSVCVSVCV